MVATFNPCGFAMLPAYLSYFLGLEGAEHADDLDTGRAVVRALKVGAVMTAGFVVVFGVLGILLEPVLNRVADRLPWLTIVLGVVLVGPRHLHARRAHHHRAPAQAEQGHRLPRAHLGVPLRHQLRPGVAELHLRPVHRGGLHHHRRPERARRHRRVHRLRPRHGPGADGAHPRHRPGPAVARAPPARACCPTSTGSRARCSCSPAPTSSTTAGTSCGSTTATPATVAWPSGCSTSAAG